VAYLCDITEIDPVEGDLPFERFMTEGRTSLPDFDCDFPASKKDVMLQYLADTWGADQVVQIGTHLKLKSKGIVKDLTRSMMSILVGEEPVQGDGSEYEIQQARERMSARRQEIQADMAKVAKIIEAAESDKAGLGMAWDDLWAQFGDELQPYREKYPQLFNMADRLQGRLKSYGKHAAGVVISTGRPLTSWLPLTSGEDDDKGSMVTQFDMGALESMGLVKFDILTIRTLDTVQMAVDLIRDLRGVDVEIYSWKEEYADPMVWEEVAAAKTLGIFQIETHAGTRLCQRMGPKSLQELCDMITLVRPGPMRSGLTETYLRRRAGLEPVSYPDPRMEQVLGSTWGCMIYQEQIMQACILLGNYTSDEADEVRKILGKKKIEKIGPAGQEFVSRAVDNGMEREAAQHLWDQMAEFAKYSFGKAHAYAYAVLAYWTAWLKFHYPVEFFTAALSTIDKDRIPEFIKELRRAGYTVLPPDINASGKGFKAEPLAVRYGLDAIKGIGETAVEYLIAGQYYPTFEAFDEYVTQKGTKANAGVQMLLAKIGALDSLEPRRAGLVRLLEARKSGEDTQCAFKGLPRLHEDAPPVCGFDWSIEEPSVNPRTGKLLKLKPPPKKCTKACRQYKAPDPMDLSSVEAYDDEAIRAIEHELLGVFLSSTPFDRLDPEDRQRLYADAEELVDGEAGRFYTVAAILMGIRKTKTRASGEEMAFLTLDTEVSTVEAVCFPRKWAEIKTGMHTGQLCLVVLEKQDGDKGVIAQEYLPVH
jgi:DNA polymerase-3 subunit alpha